MTHKQVDGIKNLCILFSALLLIRELIDSFELKNLEIMKKLMKIDNPIITFSVIIFLLLRSITTFYTQSAFIIISIEIVIYYIIYYQIHGITAINITILTIINMMKLISYVIEAKNKKEILKEKKKKQEEKIYLCDFLKFILSPSLIFVPQNNKKEKNYRILIKNLFMTIFLFFLFNFFGGFYMLPSLKKFDTNFIEKGITEYLRIACYTLIFWILMFLMFFKYGLGFFSELSNYSDKLFGNWWNTNSFGEFWKEWNVSTHKWLKRYVFNYVFKNMGSVSIASFTTFIFSGIFHEICSFMIFKRLTGYFFIGILSQYFFIMAENIFKVSHNMLFWILFCFIGQPVFILSIKNDLLKSIE